MDEKLISKDNIIKMVRAYLMYTFAFTGIGTLVGFFLFNDEQTKGEIIKHLILGLIMSAVILILKGEKEEEKLSRDQTKIEK